MLTKITPLIPRSVYHAHLLFVLLVMVPFSPSFSFLLPLNSHIFCLSPSPVIPFTYPGIHWRIGDTSCHILYEHTHNISQPHSQALGPVCNLYLFFHNMCLPLYLLYWLTIYFNCFDYYTHCHFFCNKTSPLRV